MLAQSPNPWCVRCTYSLADLDPDGLCPECSHPVLTSLRAQRRLRFAPRAFLRRVSLGLALIRWGGLTSFVAAVVIILAPVLLGIATGGNLLATAIPTLGLIALPAALGLAIGGWLVTSTSLAPGLDGSPISRRLIRVFAPIAVPLNAAVFGYASIGQPRPPTPALAHPLIDPLWPVLAWLPPALMLVLMWQLLEVCRGLAMRTDAGNLPAPTLDAQGAELPRRPLVRRLGEDEPALVVRPLNQGLIGPAFSLALLGALFTYFGRQSPLAIIAGLCVMGIVWPVSTFGAVRRAVAAEQRAADR